MRSILHVDMDAFYASVEQLDKPEYKGRPVIVGADPRGGAGRGVVAACSYEARKFGVRSALPISRAWKLCPQGVYVRPRMKRYVEVSHQIMAVFRKYTDLVEPLSIDEAFLDVTGSAALFGPPNQIALAIKKEIRDQTGLTASIGVAPNKFLAKIASIFGSRTVSSCWTRTAWRNSCAIYRYRGCGAVVPRQNSVCTRWVFERSANSRRWIANRW
jgi:nucleotidyltransferase/DNA polymerase involved in DNA repair